MRLVAGRGTKAFGAALGWGEVLHLLEARANNRQEHQLGDAHADRDCELLLGAVPQRHRQLALIVRVDQAH